MKASILDNSTALRRAAVIGHPIAHSLSPRLFGLLARRLGFALAYEKFDISPDTLATAVEEARREQRFTGWSVTLPHKIAVLALAGRVSPEARRAGAANVLHFVDGVAVAHNTDGFGVLRTLQEQQFDPSVGSAVIFGAGGAARAVACAVALAGSPLVLVCNRTRQRAQSLCADLALHFPSTVFRPVSSACELQAPIGLVVNATSLGLPSNPGGLPCPVLEPGALAFDVVYASEATPFLRDAAGRGARTVDGLDMLVWQALAAWEIWFGPVDEASAVKRSLKALLQEKE